MTPRCRSSTTAAFALALAATLHCQDDRPTSLPIQAGGEVDATQIGASGRVVVKLHFVSEAVPSRAFAVRVELRRKGKMVVQRDHAPPVPTTKWAKGKPIDYELPFTFALPPAGVANGDELEVFVAFLDPATDKPVAPLSRAAGADGFVRLGAFVFQTVADAPDAAAVDAVIAAALAIAQKQPQAAWDQLEFTFRRLDDYPLKGKLQKAMLTVGRMPPPPLSFEEQDIVQGRIAAERARWLRQVAGRMYDRGKLLGALLLLDEVGGGLQEQADRAVLGALGGAKRVTQDRDDIAAKVFALTEAQQAEVAEQIARHPDDGDQFEMGVKLAKNPATRAVGRQLVLLLQGTAQHGEQAKVARAAIEKEWLSDVPPGERTEAEAALQHPCWARTASRASHRFVLIGPQQLVEGVPDDSLLRFDLAYVYLTDLFGRVPNPEGDRVTVYWKELWEFGGGVGGGKIIDIGNADPLSKATRVDNGLYYHELTHCIDDTNPVYGGMHEGLADFGAAFAQMELGQIAGARGAFGIAARAFLMDYLERDLEYWRIPNYGPSAGFLLHFISAYGKSGEGYRWQLYRKFFRDYRSCAVKDTRAPNIARAFAFHLAEAFGPQVLADLQRFRWPLLDSDLEAAKREQLAAKGRSRLTPTFDDMPGSPVPRDRVARELHEEQAGIDEHAEQLGVVRDWWVIGPFRRAGVDPDAFRFPPELEIDLGARYESINNNPTWRRPGEKPVTVDETGWLQFDFSYQDDSATYALTHVSVEHDTEAWFHIRGDDDLTLFVNDRLIGKFDGTGGRVGPWRPDRRVLLPDAIRFAVTLHKGRNKVLLKVRNQQGAFGCTLAIAQRNGLPLPGWTSDVLPPQKKLVAIDLPDGARWSSRFRARFDSAGAHRKVETPIGKWRVRNDALEGFASAREVEWRKYTVRPGFPKDSPSNLAWLPEKETEDIDAFHLTVELAPGSGAPKLCVIVQGDGHRDALSGWTLILEPQGDAVRAWLERYDQRIYMSDAVPFTADAKKTTRLELSYQQRRLTVRLGGQVVFEQASLLPIPGRHRIGIATWGENLRIEEIELRAPTRTR